jgi:fused signal recognition particle receptor
LIGRIGRGFSRLKEGLQKTRNQLGDGIRSIVSSGHLDEETWEEIEELLLKSDVGAAEAEGIAEELRKASSHWKRSDSEEVLSSLRDIITDHLGSGGDPRLNLTTPDGPAVVLVVGVNGVGKTTTIAKLAARIQEEGKRILLVAGDTFRMAAVEQLETWAERVGVPIVRGAEGADAAAVVFDGLESAIARNMEVVIVDTAGRLHTKSNLMEELAKVKRIVEKRIPGSPHEILLVLDATTGQNGLQQARAFSESLGITGLVLAKLDGTARGGVVLAIRRELSIPIKLVGTGEKLDDLDEFDPAAFAEAMIPGSEPAP